ncbi:MAG TPA: hypothetical protein VF049_02115 [Nocardioidaceae bacterium]|jgi:hypothetical protein
MNQPRPFTDQLASRPMTRAGFLRLTTAVAAGLALPGALPASSRASTAVADRVHVDLATTLGEPTYRATGFLHGLSQDGTQPSDELLRPLRPQLFRGGGSTLPGGGWGGGGPEAYAVRWDNVVARFNRVSKGPINAEYCIVISDLWGANGVDLQPTDPYPGDDGDWSSYEQFITRIVTDAHAAGMRPNQIQYEIWNEPDYGNVYWPRPKAQYEEMWRRGVRLIRRLDPRARIAGPTFTRITVTESSWHMDEWLDMVAASDTAPDILTWHDLIPGRDPVDQAELARRLLTERGLDEVLLEINEYPASDALDPGYNTWYVSRLERARIDYAVLAIYGPCCMYPQLDGLLTQQGEQLFTTGRWWAYERYAAITGDLVATRPGTVVEATAGVDGERGQARIVLGNRIGNGSDLGTVRVTVDGVPALRYGRDSAGRVPVRLERIADRDKLAQPEVVRDVTVKPTGSTIEIEIPWNDSASAYAITLGTQDSTLPPFVIIDAEPAEPVLLPDEPTPVSFRLRNYTDEDLTLSPELSVPAGYEATAPGQVTVPANGDARLQVTITRHTADLAEAEMRLTIDDQSLVVPLQPSENWARIAAMSASSTHAPSSPANLNDGNTDSERWGGGGAGGWNDDTANTFPDTVTAAWTHPVSLARVRVFTLDSAAFPASAWGVRDYDVLARVGGTWQKVAEVRGNTSGMVESRFAAVSADQLRISVLASNSGDYSRLLEVEAYTS